MTTQTQTDNQFYVRLVREKPLDKSEVKQFYKAVSGSLPNGVLASLQVERPGYGLDTVRLIHKPLDAGTNGYEIPLSRHLTDKEFSFVCDAVAVIPVEGYELQVSGAEILDMRQIPAGAPQFEPENYEILCDTLAKYQHSNWCSERSEAGWRFGESHNIAERTTPLLRPWQDLPQQYKKVDKNLPTEIFNILESMGYVVIPKEELNKFLKKKKR